MTRLAHSRRFSRTVAVLAALALLISAACGESRSNPLVPTTLSTSAADTVSDSALTAGDDCTVVLSPASKTIRGITSALIELKVTLPKAKNKNGCRWSFDSVSRLPIIRYGTNKVIGYKSSGETTITIDLPASVQRSLTQTRDTLTTVFTLKGPQNTVRFDLTADRWCPERNWC
jgi:hypothetical protein